MRKPFILAFPLFFSALLCQAQSVYLPYSYQLDQKFNSSIYSVKSSLHTALKPFLLDSTLTLVYNVIMNRGVDSNRKTWIVRKLFNEHIFDVKTKDYTFYADYLPDLTAGRDLDVKKNTYLNTRGFQLGGTVGSKFSFYSSGFENSARFPEYFSKIVNKIAFIPGQAYIRNYSGLAQGSADWSYTTAIVSYTPFRQLNITLGTDKTFIGDGYRSLLLSDFAANYPLLRVTANLGSVQYMIMWTNMEDINQPKFDVFYSNRRKWAAFHYLDWNITNRLSVGFFDAVIVQQADDYGNFHGFDANLINPLFFSAKTGPATQPDNVLAGFTAKYKFFDKAAVYAQLLMDNSNADGYQVGVRGADLFGVKGFNYLAEYNRVKPFAYMSPQVITNYTDYSQPLGDPLGANFRETVVILNYSMGNFDFMAQINYARYGRSPAGSNYGDDLTYPSVSVSSNAMAQGIPTTLYYGEGTTSYLINPKYNLRIEIGGLIRNEKDDVGNHKTALMTFGLRSSFRSIYHDF